MSALALERQVVLSELIGELDDLKRPGHEADFLATGGPVSIQYWASR
jgi:hypothetical protein